MVSDAKTGNMMLSDLAYQKLRGRIIGLDLIPGTTLNEASLSQEMGISRTPIHEALSRLSRDGLVEVVPRRLSRVARLDLVEIEKQRYARLCIETEVFQTAVFFIDEHDLYLLRENLDAQRDWFAQGGSSSEILRLNDRFHQGIFAAARKESLTPLLSVLTAQVDVITNLLWRSIDGASFTALQQEAFNDHERMYDILRGAAAMPEDCMAFLSSHVFRAHGYFREIRRKFPDCFVPGGTEVDKACR